MRLSSDLQSVVRENEPLAPHTYMGLGGPARWLARPRTEVELAELVRCCGDAGVSVQVLGLGANLLVGDDGVEGMVVRLSGPAFRRVDWDGHQPGGGHPSSSAADQAGHGDEVLVGVGGGADMNRLARDAVRRGLAGLECMAGIPGTLGGIVRMNAGGRFGEIADVVRDVTVVDAQGRLCTLSREQAGFRYRGSDLAEAVVCRATLALKPGDPKAIRCRFLDIWGYKRQSQPLAEPSAGCVFKNPPGRSAGELIDQAGLKDYSLGGAAVSDRHANFIIVREGATAAEVWSLISLIRREVAQRFGVELELEIEVWGRQPALLGEPGMG